ncbi:MAG: hypothetical protein QNK36_10160, partial [Colwellia sp.]|nr:hypothetical protein [Colwellia sp.]
MDIELSEISSFIQSIPPFDSLPKPALARLLRELSINYVRKGQSLPPEGISEPRLYIVRKGALSCMANENELISRLGEGDLCTEFCKQILHMPNDIEQRAPRLIQAD